MADTLFTGVRQQWKPLYTALAHMARQTVGDFDERENTHGIIWTNSVTFAEIRPRKDGILLLLTLDAPHPEWQPIKTTQSAKSRVDHTFLLADEGGLLPLMEPIQAAYALAKTKRPAKQRPSASYASVEEYIAACPEPAQDILRRIRAVIQEAAPDATERISWQMPTYHQRENLVHFALQSRHIGFYPSPEGIEAFADRLAEYKTTKGGVQFPLNKPIPYELIAEITRYRVEQATR